MTIRLQLVGNPRRLATLVSADLNPPQELNSLVTLYE